MYSLPTKKSFTTSNPNINALLRYTPHEDGTIRISGYAVDAKTGIRLDGVKAKVKQAKAPEDIALKEGYLIQAILADLPSVNSSPRTHHSAFPDGYVSSAFRELLEGGDNISPSWNPKTRDEHMAYFRRNILPFLSALEAANLVMTETDLEALKESLIRQAAENKKSKQNMRSIQQTVNKSLAAAEKIYSRMCEIHSELPEIHLHNGARITKFQPEQAKSLPPAIRYRMIRLLEDTVDDDPNFAFHAILMFAFGLRDGEACAVTKQQVIYHKTRVLVSVEQQVKDGEVTDILKTSNSYRVVVGPYWPRIMMQQCEDRLAAIGEEISPYIDVSEFSSRLKVMLQRSGCEAGFFRAAQVLMDHYPDKVDDSINLDVTSYILRRDYASRARNICGLSNDEIDALLGHKRMWGVKRSQVNTARTDDQAKIAEKLERFVYNPEISLNPEFAPISLFLDQDMTLIPFNAYVFRNDSNLPLWVELCLTASEPDEEIALVTNTDAKVIDHSDTFTPVKREIIGLAHQDPDEESNKEEATHED